MQPTGWVLVRDSDDAQPAGLQLPVRATLAFQQSGAGPASVFGQPFDLGLSLPTVSFRDAAGWTLTAGSDSVDTGMRQADLAIDATASGLAHFAYLIAPGNSVTGFPTYNTFDFAERRFGSPTPTTLSAATASDVAVALDGDGTPLVAFSASNGAFVFRLDGTEWVPHAADGGQPSLPLNNGVEQTARRMDLAVDAAAGRVFVAVAADAVFELAFPTPEPAYVRRVLLCASAARGTWACSTNAVEAGFVKVAATPPLAASSVSIALRADGVPHIGATQIVTTTAPNYLSFCTRFDPQTLARTSLGVIRSAPPTVVHCCAFPLHVDACQLASLCLALYSTHMCGMRKQRTSIPSPY